jgi:hypothetical protein
MAVDTAAFVAFGSQGWNSPLGNAVLVRHWPGPIKSKSLAAARSLRRAPAATRGRPAVEA